MRSYFGAWRDNHLHDIDMRGQDRKEIPGGRERRRADEED
jgi:hypothetical protein